MTHRNRTARAERAGHEAPDPGAPLADEDIDHLVEGFFASAIGKTGGIGFVQHGASGRVDALHVFLTDREGTVLTLNRLPCGRFRLPRKDGIDGLEFVAGRHADLQAVFDGLLARR
ncbi:MAG: hypothetical protein AAGB03_03455 [Pseudomonadota bacterium]